MKQTRVSAPAKIHLMGEHAVVYSNPALLSAINLRLTVTVASIRPPVDGLEIRSPDFIFQGPYAEVIGAKHMEFLASALAVIEKSLGITYTPMQITLSSDVPIGFHLGSSAAVAVALTGALMQFYTDQFDRKKINEVAYHIEKIAHGNPSGGDNTTVTYGGCIQFQKKAEGQFVVTPLSFPSSFLLTHFFLLNTGTPESTKDMVGAVKYFFDHNQTEKKRLLEGNEKATSMVRDALINDDEHLLIEGIRQGERTLEGMGVVSKKVLSLIRAVEQAGGAAKILGGGGKKDGVGFVLCYHAEKKKIQILAAKYRYPLQEIQLGEEGVRVEQTNG